MSKAEKNYLDRVAGLGCYLCRMIGYGNIPAQIHHLREGAGMGQKNTHWLAVPLCQAHHTDAIDGWHGQRKAWKLCRVDEIDALADTIMRLNK